MIQADKTNPTSGHGIGLRDLWMIAMRRKQVVILTAVAALFLVGLVSFLMPRTYTASGQIMIEREPNILSFGEIFQIEPFNDEYYQTQYKLLQSRSLAGDTIDRIKLSGNEAFAKAAGADVSKPVEARGADPVIRRKLINEFLRRLDIRPVRKTRLVQASFDARDPKLAAEALNAFFDAYIDLNIQKKFQASEQATDFLAGQITAVQAEIRTDETKLQDYGQSKNIIALSNTENTVIGKLGELNKALTDAQIERINKETFYNEIRLATPDYIPDALSSPSIQKLREEYNRLARDYAKVSETFLPEYPQIQGLKAELDAAKAALEEETGSLIKRAYTDYQAALSRENALARAFNKQRTEAFQLNSNAIEYNSLLIEIQNQKNLLEILMKRKSEADVSSRLKGLRTSNIWVLDKAEIPSSPSAPNRLQNMFIGLFVGGFLGLGLAFLLESLDNTVKDSEVVKRLTGLDILGSIPEFSSEERKKGYGESPPEDQPVAEETPPIWAQILGGARSAIGLGKANRSEAEQDPVELIVHFLPKSTFAEHYRSIRTSLLFSMSATQMRTLAITSPLPQEGKTMTVCNLGVALAQAGKRVLMIDADLRKPRMHKVFGVKNLNGLTKYLKDDLARESLLRATPIPGLQLINAGPVPPNPLELLSSEKAARLIQDLKPSFDVILVDTPPVLAVTDALVVAQSLDGAVVVIRGGSTPPEALKKTGDLLVAHEVSCLGVIINGVAARDFDEYHYRPYYGYGRQLKA